ncbi:hypothetical protein AB8P51_03330 [Muriicola sp. SD30]|uniref:hypothetical protein n=1 Tax=Muriicola sp. SD30 TaxID=3240936 RepID=UPI00350EA1A6
MEFKIWMLKFIDRLGLARFAPLTQRSRVANTSPQQTVFAGFYFFENLKHAWIFFKKNPCYLAGACACQ